MNIHSWLTTRKIHFFCAMLIIFNFPLQAVEQVSGELELSAIAEFSSIKLKQDEWHAVIPVTSNENEYFLATKNGKIFTLKNGKVSSTPLLDLQKTLKESDVISLTAMALDPAFNYRERKGYHTFYTAHVELRSEENKNQHDESISDSVEGSGLEYLPFDAVIMRWQLRQPLNQPAKIIAQDEVIRIAIHRPDEIIKQLSFNPYTESWHDDFGLLYALMSRTKVASKASQPLYSGVILRIKPERFGLQSYTIPTNNPFIKHAKIRNEIAFMAGQDIVNFDWVKKGPYSLLIQFNSLDKSQFIRAKLGDDWREALPGNQLQESTVVNINTNKTILYHGRELKDLWGKVLQLNKGENSWQLQVLSLTSSEDLPTLDLHKLSHTAESSKFSLHKNANGELLLLEHSQQQLYAIKFSKTSTNKADVKNKSTETNNSIVMFLFMLIISVPLIYYWHLKARSKKKKHFLYQQWANFDVSTATNTLSLYQRHNKVVKKIIDITSLVSSELLLNDEVISVISADTEQGFSNAQEEQVNAQFSKEHRLKMVDNKQRKVQLRLTDSNNIIYTFCLYYRVGNIRHTKLKYSKVLNKVIDWSWLFANKINAENTEQRRIKVEPTVEETTPTFVSPTSQQKTNKIEGTDNKNNVEQLNEPSSTARANQDTELVLALDKLVEMKKQGYLSESEFNNAKAKILKDLINE